MKNLFKASIRTKITLVIAVIVLVSSIVLGAFAIYAMQQSTFGALEDTLLGTVNVASNVVNSDLAVRRADISYAAEEIGKIVSKSLMDLKIDSIKEEKGYTDLYRADANGIAIVNG